MKCPYSNCRKDYNEEWPNVFEGFINPKPFGASQVERSQERPYMELRRCRFCNQLFFSLFIANEGWSGYDFQIAKKEIIISYPAASSKFTSKKVPGQVIESFNEAERCRSVGSLTGAGACLRKAIYTVCDDKVKTDDDYREKIVNLPVKSEYKELLKQIKWLGDNVTKPASEGYSLPMIDLALDILPIIIDQLYAKDEQIEQVGKLLAKARSIAPKKK